MNIGKGLFDEENLNFTATMAIVGIFFSVGIVVSCILIFIGGVLK